MLNIVSSFGDFDLGVPKTEKEHFGSLKQQQQQLYLNERVKTTKRIFLLGSKMLISSQIEMSG